MDLFANGFSAKELNEKWYLLIADRREEALLLESASFDEIDRAYNGGDPIEDDIFEAIRVQQFSRTQQKMAALQRIFNRALASDTGENPITCEAPTIGKPKTSGLFATVTVQFPFSDGQTVSIVFHSPDNNAKKIGPSDEIIAFRWLLNKRDITHAVSPEDGQEVSLESIGKRISQLVRKNSEKFQKQQKPLMEQKVKLQELKGQVSAAETQSHNLMAELKQAEEDALKVDDAIAKAKKELEALQAENQTLEARIAALSAEQAAKTGSTAETGRKAEAEGVSKVEEVGGHPVTKLNDGTVVLGVPDGYGGIRAKTFANFKQVEGVLGKLKAEGISAGLYDKGRVKYIKIEAKAQEKPAQIAPIENLPDGWEVHNKEEAGFLYVAPEGGTGVQVSPRGDGSFGVELLVQGGKVADYQVYPTSKEANEKALSLISEITANSAATRAPDRKIQAIENLPDGWEVHNKEEAGFLYVAPEGGTGVQVSPRGDGSFGVELLVQGGKVADYQVYPTSKEANEKALSLISEITANSAATRAPDRKIQAIEHIKVLRPFMSKSQIQAISDAMRGEEKDFFFEKLTEYANLVANMPNTYGQDGKGDDAVVYLHYFKGGSDWYVTEKDAGSADDELPGQQTQAFGYTVLNGDKQNAELGYINLDEITSAGAELDLYWKPKTLGEIKAGQGIGAPKPEETTSTEVNRPEQTQLPFDSSILSDFKVIPMIGERPADVPEGWPVFNAPRPLDGAKSWQGDFRHGIYYAAVDPSLPEASRAIENNKSLDGWLVLYLSEDEVKQKALAWAKREYPDYWQDADEQDIMKSYLQHSFEDKKYGEIAPRDMPGAEVPPEEIPPVSEETAVKELPAVQVAHEVLAGKYDGLPLKDFMNLLDPIFELDEAQYGDLMAQVDAYATNLTKQKAA